MSKRKVVVGGYEDSSDASENESVNLSRPPAKKLAPYAPPRITMAAQQGVVAFQIPKASKSSTSSTYESVLPGSAATSTRSTPMPEHTARQMLPSTHGSTISQEAASDSKAERVVAHGSTINIGPKSGGNVLNVNSDVPPVPHQSIRMHSSLSQERQINELIALMEEHWHLDEERYKAIDEKLTQLLAIMGRQMVSGDLGASTPILDQPAQNNTPALKPYLSNPSPTPELISIVSNVVSEARNRVGKKKGGPEDNTLKEHARNTFYRMLGISAAKSIRPYFEDDLGEPDTLPTQFVDPATKYCQPYPHWKAPLTKQVSWIPTFLLRFRSTIPNDQSDRSVLLHSLSDEQIIILLHDGPFKSAQTAWREMKKTDEEVEAMRASARRYQRADRKAAVRGEYTRTIQLLQGPEWEYLSHPGYVSQDESDDDGGLITKRPEYRAQWESNLYDAIRAVEFEKSTTRPGYRPRVLRRIEVVKRPIPLLERGTGSSKVVVRIASCGISKAWREQNPEELKKYAHLINTKATTKPDIKSFLADHPMPDNDWNDQEGNSASNWGLNHNLANKLGGLGSGDGMGVTNEQEGYKESDVGMRGGFEEGRTMGEGGDGENGGGSYMDGGGSGIGKNDLEGRMDDEGKTMGFVGGPGQGHNGTSKQG
ncbi:hypothetical protein FS749_004775 [Ceratobasidium sp. UAMH 11750]|nr:hypothetical protein FS749_004775 [Ceratobasidium sp. UAMH 11750]